MTSEDEADVVVGKWKGGRIGTMRVMRPYGPFGGVVFREKQQVLQSDPKLAKVDYLPMLEHIVEFFRTGKPPVPEAETLEMFSFMDAAQRSKQAGGAFKKLN